VGRTRRIAVNCKNGYAGKILLRLIIGRYVVSRINGWKLPKIISNSNSGIRDFETSGSGTWHLARSSLIA